MPRVLTDQTLASVAALPLFRGVSAEELRELTDQTGVLRFEPGDTVYEQGERSRHGAMVLLQGHLEVFLTEGGVPKRVNAVRPGEVFGETALFMKGATRSASVVASRPSRCLALTAAVFKETEGSPALVAIEQQLIKNLILRARRMDDGIRKVWGGDEAPAASADKAEAPTGWVDRLRSFLGGAR